MKDQTKLKREYDTPFVGFAALSTDVLMESDPSSKDFDNWVPEGDLLGRNGL